MRFMIRYLQWWKHRVKSWRERWQSSTTSLNQVKYSLNLSSLISSRTLGSPRSKIKFLKEIRANGSWLSFMSRLFKSSNNARTWTQESEQPQLSITRRWHLWMLTFHLICIEERSRESIGIRLLGSVSIGKREIPGSQDRFIVISME